MTLQLTKQDSAVLKGIAIVLMLCHHLFEDGGYGSFIGCVQIIGKVCVSMFLFVSGYGLTVGMNKQYSTLRQYPKLAVQFVSHRLWNFYKSYWWVFFIFVPIGVLCNYRSLSVPYGENANNLMCLFTDVFAIRGFKSYNITWWFNQLIICLYLLFPLKFLIIKNIKPAWGGYLADNQLLTE